MQFVLGKNKQGETLILLTGYVGSEPSKRTTDNGVGILNLGMVIDYRKDIDGVGKSVWANVVAFNRLSEKNIQKGDDILVTGRVQSKKYTDNDGVEQKKNEVIADCIIVSSNEPFLPPAPKPSGNKYEEPVFADDDDLPF